MRGVRVEDGDLGKGKDQVGGGGGALEFESRSWTLRHLFNSFYKMKNMTF